MSKDLEFVDDLNELLPMPSSLAARAVHKSQGSLIKKNIYNKLNNKDVFTKETGCL